VKKDSLERILNTLASCSDFGDPKEHHETLVDLRKKGLADEEFSFLLKIIKALAHKNRFLLFMTLKEKDRCVCELEVIADKPQSSVSHQLKVLEEAQLIQGWKKGKYTHYSLVRPVFEKFLKLLGNWVEDTKNWFGELPALSEI
jgi:ArsR family transcriptional regulator